jgi:tetratricopeptide (TPR) repeat protein
MKKKSAILLGFVLVFVIFTAGCVTHYLMDKMLNGDITESEGLQLIDIFDRHIQRHPNDLKAYNDRAITFARIGKFQEAIDAYSKIIELNPGDARFFNSRGGLYFITRKYSQAIEDLNMTIKLNASATNAYRLRGGAKYFLRQYHEALEDYDLFLELEPKNTKVMALKAIALDRLEQYQEALDVLKEAIRIDDYDGDLYNIVGQILSIRLKDYHEAIQYFDRAIELNDRLTVAFEGRGLAYKGIGKLNESLYDLNRAIELMYARDIPRYYYLNRGRTYGSLKKYEAALSDFDKAITADPSYKEAYVSRGEIYEILAQESADTDLAGKYAGKAREDLAKSEQLEVRDKAEDDYLQFSLTLTITNELK